MAGVLAANGITVLTYDKRGVGESGGIYAGPEVGTNNIDPANLNLLALDASEAAHALSAHLPSKHGPIGLMGFSQAGWIIPLAAEKSKKVDSWPSLADHWYLHLSSSVFSFIRKLIQGSGNPH